MIALEAAELYNIAENCRETADTFENLGHALRKDEAQRNRCSQTAISSL